VAKDTLTTYTWPANMPANAVLFKFDLSQLPVDARIESATLSLYQTAAGGDAAYDVSVHKIINVDPDLNYANGYAYDHASEWTPSTSCYNSIPLAQSDVASALEVVSLDRSLGQKKWNVTAMAQEWVDNPATNFGLMLNSDAVAGANSYRTFAASEAIDAASRPRLEITYSINSNDRDQDGDGYTPNQSDCNDNDATVYPGAEEICEDGIDQDCSGSDAICSAEPLTVVFGDSLNTDYPGTIQDTFININNDVKVAAQVLNTYTWPANTPANAVLIKVNLSQLPADAQIQSAMLRLYQTSAGGDATYDVSAHKIINVNPDLEYATGYAYDYAGEWTANKTCYDSIPLAQSDIAPAEDVKSLDPNSGYKEWTLTGMVREWLVHPNINFGMMLNSDKVANANSFRSFQSSESTHADQRPELIVTYTERQ